MINYYYEGLLDPHHKLPKEYPQHIDKACQDIYKACKGLGTDEKALIQTLTSLHEIDRELLIRRYKETYSTDLKDLLKSESSGDFGFLLRLLAQPLPEMEAFVLNEACRGAGTTERLLYPIVVGRTPDEMNLLKRTYFDKYNKDLGVVLSSELSGDFRKVIMAAVQAPMLEFKASYHTPDRAQEDAEKLYKAGQGKWGTDEETFIKILFSSPPKYLDMLNDWYCKKYNNSIRIAIEKEFGGDAKRALLYYVNLNLEPYTHFAEHLESTMKGIGTDEKGLSTALVRYRPFIKEVSKEYERKYNKSLKDRIKGETSGDYRALLLALLDAPLAN